MTSPKKCDIRQNDCQHAAASTKFVVSALENGMQLGAGETEHEKKPFEGIHFPLPFNSALTGVMYRLLP
jgi:hypothetical protein